MEQTEKKEDVDLQPSRSHVVSEREKAMRELQTMKNLSFFNAGEQIVTFTPTGKVLVNPKFSTTAAAQAFWTAVKAVQPDPQIVQQELVIGDAPGAVWENQVWDAAARLQDQQAKCLRGEHEYAEKPNGLPISEDFDGGISYVCKHCRCLFVERP